MSKSRPGASGGRKTSSRRPIASEVPTAHCSTSHFQPDATYGDCDESSRFLPGALAGMSPSSRGHTMKECEEQLSQLHKENFNLKLRIYFLEERLGHRGLAVPAGVEAAAASEATLRAEAESLRVELADKQRLLVQAATAIDLVERKHREEVERLGAGAAAERAELEGRLEQLHKMYSERCQQLEDEVSRVSALQGGQPAETTSVGTQCTVDQTGAVQRVDELSRQLEARGQQVADAEQRIKGLEEALCEKQPEIQIKVQELRERDSIIEEKQNQIEQQNRVLVEIQITLAEKQRLIDALNATIAARDVSVARLEAELEAARARLADETRELGRVRGENEMLKTQLGRRVARGGEGRESPRRRVGGSATQRNKSLIEEAIEGIWSSPVLRTKDEFLPLEEKENVWKANEKPDRPQPIVDHEKTQLSERFSEENYLRLEREHQRGCEAIQGFIARIKRLAGENEEARRETRRAEKKLSELRAELKELRDSYNRAEWEARQLRADATGVPGTLADVRDMTEEENERLWAEVEDKNKKLAQLSLDSEKQIQVLLTSLKEKETQLAAFEDKLAARETRIGELEEKMSQPVVTNNSATFDLRTHGPSGNIIEDLGLCLRQSLIDLHDSRLWHKDGLRESLDKILRKGDTEMFSLRHQVEFREMQLGLAEMGSNRSINFVLQQMDQPAIEGTKEDRVLEGRVESEGDKLRESETARKNATNACALLVGRLEELASFLVSLLRSPERLGDLDRLSISRAVQRSVDLSRQLSASVSEPLSPACPEDDTTPTTLEEGMRVIARLRARIEVLRLELRQRDIELGCLVRERDLVRPLFEVAVSPTTFYEEPYCKGAKETCGGQEGDSTEHACPPKLPLPGGDLPKHSVRDRGDVAASRDATALSESETWSEPDRQISLARIGLDESAIRHHRSRTLPPEQEESSGSSQETARETARAPGKPRRGEALESRRLQARLRGLEQVNEALRTELAILHQASPVSRMCSPPDPETPPGITENPVVVPSHLLEQIRRQREKLESSLLHNDFIRRQLEGAFLSATGSRPGEGDSVLALESRLRLAEEKAGELEMKLREAEALLAESSKQAERLAESERRCEETRQAMSALEQKIGELEALVRVREAEIDTKEALVQERDAEIATKEVEIKTKQALVQEKDNKIAQKEGLIREKDNEIAKKEALVRERDHEIAKKEALICEREHEITKKEGVIQEKDNEIAKKEGELETKEALVREKNNEIATKEDEIATKDSRITEMEERAEKQKAEIHRIVQEMTELKTESERRVAQAEERLKDAKSVLLNKVEDIEREMLSYEKRSRDTDLELKEAKGSLNEALMQRSEANKVIEMMKVEFSSRVRAFEETQRGLELRLDRAEEETSREVDRRSRKLEEAERQLKDLRWAHEAEVEAASRRARDEGALAASTAALEASRLANEKLRLEQQLRSLEADWSRERLEAEGRTAELRRREADLEARTRELEAVNAELRSRLERVWGAASPPPAQAFHRPDARDNGYASGRGWTPDNRPRSPDSRSPLSSLVLQRGFGRQHSEFSDYVSEDADYETVVTRSCWITTVTNRGAHSPDLGIESDQGRMSSLEAQGDERRRPEVETTSAVQTIRRGRSNHNCTAIEEKNFELKRELCQTRRALEDTLAQLTAANHRKQNVEKAICKQIEKTCSLLQETRGNLQPEHLMLCNDRT